MYRSASCCFSIIIGSVWRNKDRAAPNSLSSISSNTICCEENIEKSYAITANKIVNELNLLVHINLLVFCRVI